MSCYRSLNQNRHIKKLIHSLVQRYLHGHLGNKRMAPLGLTLVQPQHQLVQMVAERKRRKGRCRRSIQLQYWVSVWTQQRDLTQEKFRVSMMHIDTSLSPVMNWTQFLPRILKNISIIKWYHVTTQWNTRPYGALVACGVWLINMWIATACSFATFPWSVVSWPFRRCRSSSCFSLQSQLG